jgi:hypothetical protein
MLTEKKKKQIEQFYEETKGTLDSGTLEEFIDIEDRFEKFETTMMTEAYGFGNTSSYFYSAHFDTMRDIWDSLGNQAEMERHLQLIKWIKKKEATK